MGLLEVLLGGIRAKRNGSLEKKVKRDTGFPGKDVQSTARMSSLRSVRIRQHRIFRFPSPLRTSFTLSVLGLGTKGPIMSWSTSGLQDIPASTEPSRLLVGPCLFEFPRPQRLRAPPKRTRSPRPSGLIPYGSGGWPAGSYRRPMKGNALKISVSVLGLPLPVIWNPCSDQTAIRLV